MSRSTGRAGRASRADTAETTEGSPRDRSAARGRSPGCARLVRALALATTVVAGASACHDPYAEVRARLTPAEVERFDRGARAAAPCATCHDLAGDAVKIGPPLSHVAGRRAGGVPGFAYSPAMAQSTLVWDARSLAAFLADPQRVVPGNRMVSPGVADPSELADLVFFLIEAGGHSPQR